MPTLEQSLLAARPDAVRVAQHMLGGDRDAAEDLVADVVARLWERGSVTDQVFGTGYVIRSVRNAIRDRWRTKARHDRALASLRSEVSVDRSARTDDLATDRVHAASLLAQLTGPQREIVSLRYLHDRPQAEVAARAGVAKGTVASSSARSLELLRRIA